MKHDNPAIPLLAFLAILLFSASSFSPDAGMAKSKEQWVDSVYRSLTTDQQIAQLFIIRAYSNKEPDYNKSMADLVHRYNPGGLCFFQGTPFVQATLTNRWQETAQTPMLIAIDAEWGLGMRLEGGYRFPYQMTLGAAADEHLIYDMASAIARDCSRMGIHINLAPVADVNNNASNPVINFRSFGEDPLAVGRKAILYTNGLQDNGIMATAKHFPGHGDTDTDSHLTLPVVNHPAERLDSVELAPFRELIRNGATGIMIAHLYVPAYETTPDLATTLSPRIVTDLLKTRMGFSGWVITDALDMKGVTRYFPPGEIEVRALLAGNDILLLPQDLPKAIHAIRNAMEKGTVPASLIEKKCKRILELKYDLRLPTLKPVDTDHLLADLNPVSSKILSRTIYKSAVTLVRNNNLIPVNPGSLAIATLSIGSTGVTTFQETIDIYAAATHFQVAKTASVEELNKLATELSLFDLVIIGLHNNNLYPANRFGNPDRIFTFIQQVSLEKPVILTIFGNPYILESIKEPNKTEAILVTYQDQPEAETVAAEILFGSLGAAGRLPVGTSLFPAGTGLDSRQTRLEQVFPEEVGIPSGKLKCIDSIALSGISAGAYPGCQVLFVRKGKIVYNKSFGNPTYEHANTVKPTDIYDLASVTKIAATTVAIMKLTEDRLINPDLPISIYLPELTGTNKGWITIREIMAHQARLKPWIPFYITTLKEGDPDPELYSRVPDSAYPVRVSSRLYARKQIRDSVFGAIISSDLLVKKKYRYSDLGFYLLKEIVERQTGISFSDYMTETFYAPLGMTNTGFLPWQWCPVSRLMPTENDTIFRKHLIKGDVHDPGAAMLGGISGHAGLFSNAGDLAILFQMLLNGGIWNGKRYLLPFTIDDFTCIQYPENDNRRGMGFDKPLCKYDPAGPTCEQASLSSYGHSGFTGPYIWVDPDKELIYIFLANRVYPDAGNFLITKLDIRTNIHRAMYRILDENTGI